jgi:hypothetical protein
MMVGVEILQFHVRLVSPPRVFASWKFVTALSREILVGDPISHG